MSELLQLDSNAHTIIGTVTGVLVITQVFVGFIHHFRFRKTQRKTLWTAFHIWYGRVIILLGIINGGLGLQLAANTTAGEIAYGVVAGVVGLGYITTVTAMSRPKEVKRESESVGKERI